MASVSMDKDLAIGLIESRLREIKGSIGEILSHWDLNSAMILIDKSRKGELPESEMDAIALTNLLDHQNELEMLLQSYGGS